MKKITVFTMIEAFNTFKDELKEKEYSMADIQEKLETTLNASLTNKDDCAFDYLTDIYEVIIEIMVSEGFSYINEEENERFVKEQKKTK